MPVAQAPKTVRLLWNDVCGEKREESWRHDNFPPSECDMRLLIVKKSGCGKELVSLLIGTID